MINYISFADKNKNGKFIEQIFVTSDNINQILLTINQSIDFLNEDHLLIKSVNGKVGNIEIKFPVLSVNGKYNDVNLNLNSYVNSVNGKTGNVKIDFPVLSVNNKKDIVNIAFPVLSVNKLVGNINLKTSNIDNDVNYITVDDIKVYSVNDKLKNIIIKISQLQNIYKFITIDNILVNSVNNKTGNVQIVPPVLSVNNEVGKISFLEKANVTSVNSLTGNVILKTSNIENDVGYITSDNILVKSIYITNNEYNTFKSFKITKIDNLGTDKLDLFKNISSTIFNVEYNNLIDLERSWLGNYNEINYKLYYNKKLSRWVLNDSDFGNYIYTDIENPFDKTALWIRNSSDDRNVIVKLTFEIIQANYTISATNDVKIFVPSAISQLQNDINLFNNTNQFIKVYQNNIEDLNNFITCRSQKYAAFIDLKKCIGCGKCKSKCQYNAIQIIKINNNDIYQVNPINCVNCKLCFNECQVTAISQKLQ